MRQRAQEGTYEEKKDKNTSQLAEQRGEVMFGQLGKQSHSLSVTHNGALSSPACLQTISGLLVAH